MFIKDPATADSLGASATLINTLPFTTARATSAYDPRTDSIVLPNTLRTRTQVIGTTSYTAHLIESSRTSILAAGTSGRFDQWTAANGLTVTADSAAAPNGETIAQTLTDPGASLSSARQTFTVADDSLPHVFSIYVLKTAGGTAPTFGVTMALTGGTGVTTNARINTDTGAQQYGSNVNTTVVNANSTYWRVVVMVTNNTTANTTLTLDVYPAAAAYGASVDSAAATGSAICAFADLIKAANGVGTALTYQSFISNRNMLLRSEEFNSSWTKTRMTVTSNSTANPLDSAVTADTFVEDSSVTTTHLIVQAVNKPSSAAYQYTFTVYIAPSSRTWALVRCTGSSDTNGKGIYFNLSGSGSTGSTETTGAGFTLDASSITAVGSFYRCLITVTTDTAATIRPAVFAATGDNGKTYTGTGVNSLILYGAQLVFGTTAQNYWAVSATVGSRALDDVSVDVSSLSGGGISTTEGTLIAVARPYGWNGNALGTTATFTRHSASPIISLFAGTLTTSTAQRQDTAGTLSQVLTKTWSDGVTGCIGMTWSASGLLGYRDGYVGNAIVAPTTLPYITATSLPFGQNDSAPSQSAYGYLLLFYWPTALTPAQQQIFFNGIVQ